MTDAARPLATLQEAAWKLLALLASERHALHSRDFWAAKDRLVEALSNPGFLGTKETTIAAPAREPSAARDWTCNRCGHVNRAEVQECVNAYCPSHAAEPAPIAGPWLPDTFVERVYRAAGNMPTGNMDTPVILTAFDASAIRRHAASRLAVEQPSPKEPSVAEQPSGDDRARPQPE